MTTERDLATQNQLDADLRADIRRLGVLLGQTLARQEGQELLDLVEEVRGLVRTDAGAAAVRLGDVDVVHGDPTRPRLRDVLPSGQHHRAGAPGPGAAAAAHGRGWLARPGRAAHPGTRRARRWRSPPPPDGCRCARSSRPTRPRRPGGRSWRSCAPWRTNSTRRPRGPRSTARTRPTPPASTGASPN